MKTRLLLLLALAGCKQPASTDGGAPPTDGGGAANDAGGTMDAGPTRDAGPPDLGQPRSAHSLTLSSDGKSLWVVNPESDSISEIDLGTRALVSEFLLGAQRPTVGPTNRYDPAIRPRSIALVDSLGKAYVAGQMANQVYVVSMTTGMVMSTIPAGTEPVSVVATADGSGVWVVSHQSATVEKIDTATDAVVATVSVGEHPWGASLRANGTALYVSHLLMNPAVTVIDTASAAVTTVTLLPDQPLASSKLVPNGPVRGCYAAVPRPNDGTLWVPHMLLSTNTPQPQLDFQSSVFPTITRLPPGAASVDPAQRILFKPSTVAGATGSFTDSVSGPRDLAFTPDGSLALLALAQSEDVMVFDASTGFELSLVRPVPSALLEGIVIDAAGTHAYVQGRNTHDVTVLDIAGQTVTVDGSPIECLQTDPMPANLRRGMRLFYSANSSAFPVTQNFWIACASCHLEGQSDAVVWKFAQGPRDTPSNAGGPINTGFLFRQAVRSSVMQYDETIRIEQGGSFSTGNATQLPDLQALADFTNYAIPFARNPNLAPNGILTDSQDAGAALFAQNCAGCHSGPFFTDSGKGNPTLDLCGGPVLLHDVGTCHQDGGFDDTVRTVYDGGCSRQACQFDTPTLRGIFASAPYFHDGSANTLDDAVGHFDAFLGLNLSPQDHANLVAYLKTL